MGNKWKKILTKYLTKLKIFRLRMYFEFPHHKNVDEQLEKLINTYRNTFWIDQHQWFVQCDCIPFGTYHHGILYTLPYAFDSFVFYDTPKSKYTCPNDMFYWIYNQVNNLQYMKYKTDSILLPFQFPNIRHLKIGIPFDENFRLCIPSLHQLTSLEAIPGENFRYDQLQILINLSPHLYSLRFFCSIGFNVSITRISSPSIRRLNFITKCSSSISYFNQDECAALAYSQLGQQCEVLLIKIENRINVLDLTHAINTWEKMM